MTGKTKIHIIEGTINEAAYKPIIMKELIRPRHFEGKLFQQDNAAVHVCKGTKAFFALHGVKLMENYSPYSPELNPIEKVWSWMSKAVNRIGPETSKDLINAIRLSWRRLPQEIIQNYIQHLIVY